MVFWFSPVLCLRPNVFSPGAFVLGGLSPLIVPLLLPGLRVGVPVGPLVSVLVWVFILVLLISCPLNLLITRAQADGRRYQS